MDGEQNGTQEQQGATQEVGQQQTAQQPQQETQGAGSRARDGQAGAPGGKGTGNTGAGELAAQLAERDSRIVELEAQIAAAAQSAEAAESLRAEIAALKQQGEDERVEFGLKLADVRNVKAAKAVLGDFDGDIDALKAAEPWMFQDAPAKQAPSGKTGLPNAGAAVDSDKQMRHWREVAGLSDAKEE